MTFKAGPIDREKTTVVQSKWSFLQQFDDILWRRYFAFPSMIQTVSWTGGCSVTGWRTCWAGRRRGWTWRSLCRCCWSCVSETREPGRCTRAQYELVGKPFYLPSYNTGNCRKGLITPLPLLPPLRKIIPHQKKLLPPPPLKAICLQEKVSLNLIPW